MQLRKIKYLLLPVFWLSLLLATSQSGRAALSLQSNDPIALVKKGDALLWQSNFSAAEQAYNTAIVTDSENAQAYAHRCYLRTYQQQFDEGIADCQQAVALAPKEAEGYIYLTRAYDWSGEFSAAIE